MGQSGRSGFMSTALWQCLLACRRLNLCFNKQQIFGRFPRKQTWPAVECCSSSAVDLRFCWSVPRSGAGSDCSLLLFCQKATKERTEEKTARLLHPSQVAYICGPLSVRGTRPSTYATQTVIMSWKSNRGAGWAPFRETERLLQAVSKLSVLLKTPLLP